VTSLAQPGGAAPAPRRHDLDWLRIAAFGLLIGYHVGMLYVPWTFHGKSENSGWPVLKAFMLALNPWRLSLLFVISGAATAFMVARVGRVASAGSGRCSAFATLAPGSVHLRAGDLHHLRPFLRLRGNEVCEFGWRLTARNRTLGQQALSHRR